LGFDLKSAPIRQIQPSREKSMTESTQENISTKPQYEFEHDYVTRFMPTWDGLLAARKPKNILEIGCYEGLSTCYWIDKCSEFGPVAIYCLDMWDAKSTSVREQRFDHNTDIAKRAAKQKTGQDVILHKIKGESKLSLAKLLVSESRPVFDFIYVDGDHRGVGVLSDAVLSFDMLRNGGIMLFDDYLWAGPVPQYNTAMENADIHNVPKIGIDSFINVYQRQLRIVPNIPLYQIAIIKVL
jgi:predicted O-methyltransferase YrrM